MELALFVLRTIGNMETRLVRTVMVYLSICIYMIYLYCGLLEHARKVGIVKCGGTKCLRLRCGIEVTLVQLGSVMP